MQNLEAKPVNEAQREMDEAVSEWLRAYEDHKRYMSATKKLFTAFTGSWHGSSRHVAEAFSEYCEALLRESGRSHAQITEAFPMGKTKSQ